MTLSRLSFLALLIASPAAAHDMVQQGSAGEYELTVFINPHARASGFVELVARAGEERPDRVEFSITPIDRATAGTGVQAVEIDGLFRASLPLPPAADWRVHVTAEGAAEGGAFSVPVAAAAPFAGVAAWAERGLRFAGWTLASLALFVGLRRAKRGVRMLPVSAAVASPLLFVGWTGDVVQRAFYHPAVYSRLYQPANLDATVEGGALRIALSNPGVIQFRRFDDLLPDHGHPMHLYALRTPQLDRVYHLHPETTGPGSFEKKLPNVSAGSYFTVADIVHESGLWEAPQGRLDVPIAVYGGPFEGDDSGGAGHPISEARFEDERFELDDGLRMRWRRPRSGLRAGEPMLLSFELEDPSGSVVQDAELYMGMMGHAAIVRHDLEVFSHVHPTGSISMASLEAFDGAPGASPMCHMPDAEAMPGEVRFPYAFPEPGNYRLIVQMKRAGQVKTAFFDAIVDQASATL